MDTATTGLERTYPAIKSPQEDGGPSDPSPGVRAGGGSDPGLRERHYPSEAQPDRTPGR